jgi:hypothetical protein
MKVATYLWANSLAVCFACFLCLCAMSQQVGSKLCSRIALDLFTYLWSVWYLSDRLLKWSLLCANYSAQVQPFLTILFGVFFLSLVFCCSVVQ